MKIPNSLTTVTPFSKLIALLFVILLPIIGFICGIRYQKTFNQTLTENKINKSTNISDKKISQFAVNENCAIDVTLESGEIIKNAIKLQFFRDLPGQGCTQKFNAHVSNSGKYIAFEDLSGGVDSVISIYSIDQNKTTDLYVYGTSTIFDFAWAQQEDTLFVMNGYKNINNEQWLTAYDIHGLYKNYQANILKDYAMFSIKDNYKKSLKLTEFDKDYTHLKLSTSIIYALTDNPNQFSSFSSKDYSFNNN